MPKSVEVARHLLQLASQEVEPTFLTHLHLQKLLYYVQGWSLAQLDKPMFNSRIEAWKNGPVVKDVYPVFADYREQPIINYSVKPELCPEDKFFAAIVWSTYKTYSAGALWRKTHAEPPWKIARGNLPAEAKSSDEILPDVMKEFFRGLTDDRPPFDDFAGMPSWRGFEGEQVAEIVQSIFANRSPLLKKLAE